MFDFPVTQEAAGVVVACRHGCALHEEDDGGC